jgi:hypothetical protein
VDILCGACNKKKKGQYSRTTHQMEQNIKTKISAGMLIVVCCMVSVSVFMPPSNIQGQNKHKNGNLAAKEVYTGTAVAVVGSFGGASRPFTIEISGYTPDEEVQQDFQILRTQGQDDFMKAIGPRNRVMTNRVGEGGRAGKGERRG